MLTDENLNVNILCFTEHWLSEVQMNVLILIILDWLVILVEDTVHQEDHVHLQEIPLKRRKFILRNWELKKFLNYLQLN